MKVLTVLVKNSQNVKVFFPMENMNFYKKESPSNLLLRRYMPTYSILRARQGKWQRGRGVPLRSMKILLKLLDSKIINDRI